MFIYSNKDPLFRYVERFVMFTISKYEMSRRFLKISTIYASQHG